MILREEIEKDGKISIFKHEIIMIFFLESAFKKSKILSSERVCSIAQLEDLEVDEMNEDQLQEMAETFFDESI